MNKKILIVGGGLTGLSAGIFGRLAGFDTHVFEAHTTVGGVCTGWKRSGYTFDGCFHWWIGSIPESPFYPLFEKVGIFPETRPIKHPLFTELRLPGQKPFTVWNDPEKLKRAMLSVAPEDTKEINALIEKSRLFGNMKFPVEKPMEAFSLKDWITFGKAAGPAGSLVRKYLKLPMKDYVKRFRNENFREILLHIFPPYIPVFVLMNFLGYFFAGDGTFPEGGAPLFMERIEKRYRELGGVLSTGCRVKKIIIEKNRAIGLELTDGTIHRGDYVLSAADGHSTLFDMVGEQYVTPKLKKLYDLGHIFKPLVMVCFGVNAELSRHPHSVSLIRNETAAGIPVGGMMIKHYGFDPTLSPAGKTACSVMMETEYEPWEKLKREGTAYGKAKEEFAALALRKLVEVFPEAEGKIEVTDVSTPMTFVRYTSAWKGSYEGWTPSVKNLGTRIPKTLPKVKNFRMAGQWVEPGGGIPSTVKSGYDAIWLFSNTKG